MLNILKKIRTNSEDYSDRELDLLKPYRPYLAKVGYSDLLRKAMAKDSALSMKELHNYLWEAGTSGEATSVKEIFHRAASFTSTETRKLLIEDSEVDRELFYEIVSSGSVESIRQCLEYMRENNADIIKEILSRSLIYVRHIEVFDEIIKQSRLISNENFAKEIILNDGTFLLFNMVESDQPEKYRYFLNQFHEIGGVETLLQVVGGDDLLKGGTFDLSDAREILEDVFFYASETFGVEFIKKFFVQNDYMWLRVLSGPNFPDTARRIRGFADTTSDKEFIDDIKDFVDQFFAPETFEEEVERFVDIYNTHIGYRDDQHERALKALISFREREEDRKISFEDGIDAAIGFMGVLSEKEQDHLIQRCMRQWCWEKRPHSIELDKCTGSMLVSAAIKEMIKINDFESIEKISELLAAAGDATLINQLISYFEQMIVSKAHVSVSKILDMSLSSMGKRYTRNLLCAKIAVHEVYPLQYAVGTRDAKMVSILIDAIRESGEDEFLNDMLCYDNFAFFKKIEMLRDAQIMHIMLEALSSSKRQDVFEHISPAWKNLYSGKITKTNFWQNQSGPGRWRGMTGRDCPHPDLINQSPFHFNAALYEEILPLTELANKAEMNKGAEMHAFKLSTLFSNYEEANRYLTRYGEQWHDKGSKQVVHDACLFEFPEMGIWDVKKWKDLVLKYGPDVFPYLRRASELEKAIEGEFPRNLKDLEILASQMSYVRSSENFALSKMAAAHGLSQRQFNDCLDILKRERPNSLLPEIFIDGDTLGHPNFYLTKLDEKDPRGFFLGEMTSCCQSIGSQGQDCALHGMTSAFGGFYVWKQKTDGKICANDTIVAQSWAWIGHDDAIVFDSFERSRSIHERLVQPFIEQFCHEVAGKYNFTPDDQQVKTISGVRLGLMGNTPSLNIRQTNNPSVPIDYNGTYYNGTVARDSETQYEILPINHSNIFKPVFPDVVFSPNVEKLAKDYITRSLHRFREEFGIIVKTGIEIEGYAVSDTGDPVSGIIQPKNVEDDLQRHGFMVRFEDENTIDYYGQYEIITNVSDPVSTMDEAHRVREFLTNHAKRYGVDGFDFSPLPFENKEASSIHISCSLWDINNKPLFSDQDDDSYGLMRQVAKGILEVQRYTTFLYSQNEAAFDRFGNTEWSPRWIVAGDAGNQGLSLRIANANSRFELAEKSKPEDIRLENRLAAADCSIVMAMAATIAGIDLALSDIEKDPGNLKELPRYPLPQSRYQAFELLQEGVSTGILKDVAGDLFKAIIEQYNSQPAREVSLAKVPALVPL